MRPSATFSKTIDDSLEDAEAALEKLRAEVDGMTTSQKARRRRIGPWSRARQS